MMYKLQDFNEVVMQSPEIGRLVDFLDGQRYWGKPTDSIYSITNCLRGTVEELKSESFRNLYMYIKLLFEQGILMVDGEYVEYHDEYGHVFEEPEFYIIATIEKREAAPASTEVRESNYFDFEDMPF